MKRHAIVKDTDGNHFMFLRTHRNGSAVCESVATKEVFQISFSELSETDRVAF